MANNNDIVSRIKSASTPKERVGLAMDYAKRDPEGAKALGWENPMLAWELYNEAQEVGAPLGELGLEGGHSMASAIDSFKEGGEGNAAGVPTEMGAEADVRKQLGIPENERITRMESGTGTPPWVEKGMTPAQYMEERDKPKRTRKEQTESDAREHENRTGEWRSPVTGGWYKKDEASGRHVPFERGSKSQPVDGKSKPYADVSKSIDGIGGGLDETKQREIEGMGWDKPVLNVAKWQAQDPLGYENARRKAFEEGRSGPQLSDIPKGVWDWDEGSPEESGSPTTDNATGDRGVLNDLGAFIFGDSTLGQDNVLGKILSGLFGESKTWEKVGPVQGTDGITLPTGSYGRQGQNATNNKLRHTNSAPEKP
jgi:hypothetical protein